MNKATFFGIVIVTCFLTGVNISNSFAKGDPAYINLDACIKQYEACKENCKNNAEAAWNECMKDKSIWNDDEYNYCNKIGYLVYKRCTALCVGQFNRCNVSNSVE